MKPHLLISLLACALLLQAAPAYREPFSLTQPDGSSLTVYAHGNEFGHFFALADGTRLRRNDAGWWVPVPADSLPSAPAMRRSPRRQYLKFGDILTPSRGLVLLVNFSDISFQSENTRDEMDSLFNGSNYTYNGANGSARRYFSDQSNGLYQPVFDVIGPITLPHNCAYYGQNDMHSNDGDRYAVDMLIDACAIVAEQHLADFSQYDYNNDGEVDFVYICYAGYGEADKHQDDLVWPHQWTIKEAFSCGCTHSEHMYHAEDFTYDGKLVDSYACSNELNSKGKRTGIGAFCHEFSHVLGMPDYYDPSFSTNYINHLTPGMWSLMDMGNYNDGGNTPPNYSVFDRYYLGWITPSVLNAPENVVLPADGHTYRMVTSTGQPAAATSTNVCYYLENRQQTGWDAPLPGHGLLVWRVEYNGDLWRLNLANTIPNEPACMFLPADGTYGRGDGGDPYPGTSAVRSVDLFTPGDVSGIVESGSLIEFLYLGGEVCADYGYTFISRLDPGSDISLGRYRWDVDMLHPVSLGYDAAKGASMGSSLDPVQRVTLTTADAGECNIGSIRVNASVASGGDARLAVFVGDRQICDTVSLTVDTATYLFALPEFMSDTIRLVFTNTCEAIYLHSVDIVMDRLEVIPVTGLTLSASSASMLVGDYLTLLPFVQPSYATDCTVVWSTDEPSVATVDAGGVVTALAEGTALIRCTTTDGGFTAECTVTVTEPVSPVPTDFFSLTDGSLCVVHDGCLSVTGLPASSVVRIVDISGRVWCESPSSGSFVVTLPPGLYFVSLLSPDHATHHSLLIR